MLLALLSCSGVAMEGSGTLFVVLGYGAVAALTVFLLVRIMSLLKDGLRGFGLWSHTALPVAPLLADDRLRASFPSRA